MKLKSLYALLFCIFMTGCLDGQKQSDHSILIAYMSTEYPELGSSVCYLNEQGDTIVPFGKYHYGGSDTIRHIGFVMEPHKPGWTTINNKGEKLFYAFSFDNGPDYVEEEPESSDFSSFASFNCFAVLGEVSDLSSEAVSKAT